MCLNSSLMYTPIHFGACFVRYFLLQRLKTFPMLFRPVCGGEHFNLLALDYDKCAIYTFTTVLISLCKTRGKFHTTLM